ncbi:hypothetical protein IQ06DRAFT_303570 [Phaeosphaeriaceae sp. SRC1lsM3a]|nr:hypothetical protein IQ06DRAFT_303570 [Stagonospora sp. SRC1lsM3a]
MPQQALTNQEADALYLRNQTESTLLRLPPELRNEFFENAFHVGTVHFPFASTHGDILQPLQHNAAPITSGARLIPTLLRRTTMCRQIRAEIAALPVKLNAFAVDISELVDMVNSLPKVVRDEIHTVKIGARDHYGADVMIQEISKTPQLPSLRKLMVRPLNHKGCEIDKLVKNCLCKWAGENVDIVHMLMAVRIRLLV